MLCESSMYVASQGVSWQDGLHVAQLDLLLILACIINLNKTSSITCGLQRLDSFCTIVATCRPDRAVELDV